MSMDTFTHSDNDVLVAMSGGVDSSVAAFLLKNQGYNCMGVTMKLYDNEDIGVPKGYTCCSLSDVEDARSVAFKIGIPYHVFNFKAPFKEEVIDKFIYSYENGLTPNPCIDCNRHLKFDALFRRAKELGLGKIATGHYARIRFDENTHRYVLMKGVSLDKDQSYVLWTLTQEQLASAIFPLGGMNKEEIRKIAAENAFINAEKHDSQDICFVPDGNYSRFIIEQTKKTYEPGNFVDESGKILGKHKGIIHYTIGQRKGLGIVAEHPLFVKAINPEDNSIVLSYDENLYSTVLYAHDINEIGEANRFEKPVSAIAKIRYRHPGSPATVLRTGDDELMITFKEPQRAITPGQSVVLYNGDDVLGGAVIKR